ncbi:MAG: hypothetical protein JF885_03525 [Candidatus Dormibacteraeota bacterium]|nr:hypothetical protein [Candidatus Dormibacteraeota bacterium]MBJ7610868.1 hypothetical protein [Candidatus Dormibacteraeota bacterium]
MSSQTKDPDRVRIGAIGAHVRLSQFDARTLTEPAREGLLDRFRREVRERAESRGEVLSQEEVTRRARHARKAHMLLLAHNRERARKEARENKKVGAGTEPEPTKEASASGLAESV